MKGYTWDSKVGFKRKSIFQRSHEERMKTDSSLAPFKAAPRVSSKGESQLKCPKCRSSDNLSANKHGFGLGKAIIGGAFTGPVGLLAGFLGSGKVKITCLKCGHAWNAGKS